MTTRVTAWCLEFYGDSSEEKPTTYTKKTGEVVDIPNGSTLYQIDTGKVFMWNSLKNTWNEQ